MLKLDIGTRQWYDVSRWLLLIHVAISKTFGIFIWYWRCADNDCTI